jgi:two-component system, response regulator
MTELIVNKRNILLVEDNPDDELLTLHAFKSNNIPNEVIVVRDGAEALEYMFAKGKYAGRDQSECPSIVLLDLNLPKIHGLDVLKALRADPKTQTQPVVILTTSVEEKDLVGGYLAGCNSYIRKPVDMLRFNEAIRQMGLYWLSLNECPPLTKQ